MGATIGIGAGLIVANVVGFPEVEGAEALTGLAALGRAASLEGIFIRAAAVDNVTAPAANAVRTAWVAGTGGGAISFGLTTPVCP